MKDGLLWSEVITSHCGPWFLYDIYWLKLFKMSLSSKDVLQGCFMRLHRNLSSRCTQNQIILNPCILQSNDSKSCRFTISMNIHADSIIVSTTWWLSVPWFSLSSQQSVNTKSGIIPNMGMVFQVTHLISCSLLWFHYSVWFACNFIFNVFAVCLE